MNEALHSQLEKRIRDRKKSREETEISEIIAKFDSNNQYGVRALSLSNFEEWWLTDPGNIEQVVRNCFFHAAVMANYLDCDPPYWVYRVGSEWFACAHGKHQNSTVFWIEQVLSEATSE